MIKLQSPEELTQYTVDEVIHHIAKELSLKISAFPVEKLAMIGIHTGGVLVAEKLLDALPQALPLGTLNIAYYRDDFSEKGLHPSVSPSTLPFDIEGKYIILVDDVVMSGRTIRAALNEIFDYGRPQQILLVTLVDIPKREIPIQPDVRGLELFLPPDQRIKLSGTTTLQLTVRPNISQSNWNHGEAANERTP